MPHYTYESEFVRCGKLNCKRCPHGPYWYAYYRDGSGKLRKKYVGKNWRDMENVAPPDPGCRLDDIFDQRRRSAGLAWEILGCPDARDATATKSLYRRLAMEHHPDRGGDERVMKRIIAAYDYLRQVYSW